jgi:hypothetical protein
MDRERSFVTTTHSLLGLAFAAKKCCSFTILLFTTTNGSMNYGLAGVHSSFASTCTEFRGGIIDSTNTLHSRIHCVYEDGLYIHVLFLHLH